MSREDGHQRRDSPSGPFRWTISENVFGSQEWLFTKTSGYLVGLKQVHQTQKVQDETLSSLKEPLVSRGIDGINWPKGCLLLCEHSPRRLKIASVQLAGTDLQVPMPVEAQQLQKCGASFDWAITNISSRYIIRFRTLWCSNLVMGLNSFVNTWGSLLGPNGQLLCYQTEL